MENEEIITVENKGDKGNPHHKPAGSPDGGQFTSGPESSGSLKNNLLSFMKSKKGEGSVANAVKPSSYTLNDILSKNLAFSSTLKPKDLENCFLAGTDKAKQVICDYFMASKTKINNAKQIAHYSPEWNCVYFQPLDLKAVGKQGGNYEMGEVFYHETFHAIDDRYGKLSIYYKLSNGKTLKETMSEEIANKKYSWNMNLFNEIKKEFENSFDEELAKIYGNDMAMDLKNKSNYFKKALNDLNNEFLKKSKYLHGDEYNKAYYEYSENFKDLKKQWKAVSDKMLLARQKAVHKYSCLSDFCSFIYKTGVGNNSICGGHPKKYWSMDGGNKAVKEMWAELGSMWARGKKDDLDRMRKYFPETVKSFEELVNKLDDIRKEKYGL